MINMLRAVARRRALELIRYPFEFFVTIGALYAIFLALFLGAKALGGPGTRTSTAISGLAVGYVVFILTQQTFQAFGAMLMNESATGTLEQLAMSPYGLATVLLGDFAAQSVMNSFTFGAVILPIMATTGHWLHFDVLSIVPLVVLMMGSVVGLGLAVGGLATVFKRINGVVAVLQFSFLFLVAAPVDRYPLLRLLPVAYPNFVLRRVLVRGASLGSLPAANLALMVAVVLGWLVIGLAVFARMEREARDRALLGQY